MSRPESQLNESSGLELLNRVEDDKVSVLDRSKYAEPVEVTSGLIERYIKGELHILLEFTDGESEQFGALLQGEWCASGSDRCPPKIGNPVSIGVTRQESRDSISFDGVGDRVAGKSVGGNDDKVVLVEIVEGVEEPKSLVAALVRVKPLYNLYSGLPQANYTSSKTGRRELCGILPNWESGEPLYWGVPSLVGDGQDYQVVQSASKILKDVANDKREVFGEFGESHKRPRPFMFIRVIFSQDTVWTLRLELVPSALQFTDVLLGPFEL